MMKLPEAFFKIKRFQREQTMMTDAIRIINLVIFLKLKWIRIAFKIYVVNYGNYYVELYSMKVNRVFIG